MLSEWKAWQQLQTFASKELCIFNSQFVTAFKTSKSSYTIHIKPSDENSKDNSIFYLTYTRHTRVEFQRTM